jgi:hypothetical protein
MSQYPRLLPVRQRLDSRPLTDIRAAVHQAVEAVLPVGRLERGRTVALTAGSRGIGNIGVILTAAVEAVRGRGLEPFIVPAMGSHGGATAEGQAALLAETYGLTEAAMGCPIRSSMEVVELGRTPEHDLPVYLDAHAARAGGILVINRVKAHTDFTGPWESGLMKMIAIGLGKRAQAESIHAYGAWGLRELIPEVARAKLHLAPILGGLAILEDGYDQTAEIVGLPGARIEADEPELLLRSKRSLARLPFDELDLLIVDRIGKEISGTGLDPNVIGRRRIAGEPELETPRIERILLRDLTEESHGNGIGIGLADLITRRLYDRIDWEVTNTNSLVSGFTERSHVPPICPTDRAALDTALFLLRKRPADLVKLVRIRDTLHLEHLLVSESLLPLVGEHPDLEPLGPPDELRFDSTGSLLPDETGHLK